MVKYQFFYLAQRIEETLALNKKLILDGIRANVNRWTPLHLTWWGRLESIQMVILPQVLYFFSMVPVNLGDKYYKTLTSLLTTYFWGNKTPQIALQKRQLPRHSGGVNFLAPKLHHTAFLLRQAVWWFSFSIDELTLPVWLPMEESAICRPLQYLLSSSIHIRIKLDPMLLSSILSLKFWDSVESSNVAASEQTSLWFNKYIRIWNVPFFWK